MSLIKINLKVASIILFISAMFSTWLYWGSDLKLKQLLISREWQSKVVRLIEHSNKESAVGPLKRVDVTSNVKYLPNGTYIRLSSVRLYAGRTHQPESTIEISESGDWKLSDNYLLLSPTEFKDVSDSQSKDFTPEQLNLIKQFFKMDAQQSKRIDVINKNMLLLANLNHDSTILFTN